MTVPRFWREIPQRYTLQASQCGKCKDVFFPPRAVCPACRRQSLEQMSAMNLSGRGHVLEFTKVHKAGRGYEKLAPYTLALIKTAEGPILTGQLVDCSEPKVGLPVQGVFRRLGEDGDSGVIHYGTKWAPAPKIEADPDS